MEKVRPWCGHHSVRGRLQNITDQQCGCSGCVIYVIYGGGRRSMTTTVDERMWNYQPSAMLTNDSTALC